MPRLILLNGPPGIGKTTLARRFVAERPLTFCLDVDGLRRLVGQWDRYPEQSGLLARRMAVAMAAVPLTEGHDVVVPQYIGRVAFVVELERLADDAGAAFREVLLLDTRENSVSRFYARRADPDAVVQQREAESQIGGPDDLREMFDRLEAVAAQRPSVRRVLSHAGEVDRTYNDVLAALGDR